MRIRFFGLCHYVLFLLTIIAHSMSGVAANTLPVPHAPAILVITGNIAHTNVGTEAHFDESMLHLLPAHTLHTHTAVTDSVNQFNGPLVRDVLKQVGARGDTVTAIAANNYAVDIPIRDFERFDVILATTMNGQRLPKHDKGPIWIVYPRDQHQQLQDIRYDYRWVWQLQQLVVQ